MGVEALVKVSLNGVNLPTLGVSELVLVEVYLPPTPLRPGPSPPRWVEKLKNTGVLWCFRPLEGVKTAAQALLALWDPFSNLGTILRKELSERLYK